MLSAKAAQNSIRRFVPVRSFCGVAEAAGEGLDEGAPADEVPEEHHYGGDYFGEEVVEGEDVGEKPHNQRVQPQSDYAYYRERHEVGDFLRPWQRRALVEHPADAHQIVDSQSGDEADAGGKLIVQSAPFREQREEPEIDHESRSPDECIAEQLHKHVVGMAGKQGFIHDAEGDKEKKMGLGHTSANFPVRGTRPPDSSWD